jgi:alpha-glucosidase
MQFMVPFIRDKKTWPKPPDVLYDSEWPMRQASLLFAGMAFSEPSYVELWRQLPADSDVDEVIRNFFIRQPVLWLGGGKPSRTPPAMARAEAVVVASPSKKVEIAVEAAESGLFYRITFGGKPVVERSVLGILVDGANPGRNARPGRVDRYSTNERYPWRGVHAEAVDRSRGARVHLTRAQAPEGFAIELRAFDDAAAFRFVVPGRGRHVPDASSSFRLPAGSTVWYHGARDHYEGIHQRKELIEVPEGDWAAPPLTFRLPGGSGYVSISEAALREYAGMMLQANGKNGFRERLGHASTLRYGEENAKRLAVPAAIDGTITTPWRVVLVGENLDALVNSDAIRDLAPPPDPTLFPQGLRTAWLRPDRAVWRYLDGGGDCDKAPPGPERDQCLFPVIKEFSRLAGELGFEHQVVEGQWRRWTDDQLKELVGESRQRNVSIWVWIHPRDQYDAAERRGLFERLHGLGVAGIKVDFFDHEAKEVVDLYEAILKDAAETELLVDFHGANKPTGLERTWPNEMTREGVRGLEYRSMPGWAVHNTTIPFTRFLAGPADYTPVVFGDRRKDTTWAHQIATAVVFTSPLLVYGGHTQGLLDNPASDVIKSIPSGWDETRVLPPSAIGELAVYARRRGERWFLGVLNGKERRTLRVPLSFLGKGRYHAALVADERTNGAAVQLDERPVTASDFLDVPLRDGGGFVARFSR